MIFAKRVVNSKGVVWKIEKRGVGSAPNGAEILKLHDLVV
jgi:hypothetical protein